MGPMGSARFQQAANLHRHRFDRNVYLCQPTTVPLSRMLAETAIEVTQRALTRWSGFRLGAVLRQHQKRRPSLDQVPAISLVEC